MTWLPRNMTIKEIGRMLNLEKRRPTIKNLSQKEWKAVKSIYAETARRTVPADKGDRPIVTNCGLEVLECKEDDTAIIQEETYLAKLQERIANQKRILKCARQGSICQW